MIGCDRAGDVSDFFTPAARELFKDFCSTLIS
jgi:hypothetical protein